MKKNAKSNPKDIKPDLKHDTMEYSASTDGDDILDSNPEGEDDGITAEELEMLESAGIDEQAVALNYTEIDRKADADIFFDENDTEEEYGDDDDEDEEQERK